MRGLVLAMEGSSLEEIGEAVVLLLSVQGLALFDLSCGLFFGCTAASRQFYSIRKNLDSACPDLIAS